MYTVSDSYKEAMKRPVQRHHITAPRGLRVRKVTRVSAEKEA